MYGGHLRSAKKTETRKPFPTMHEVHSGSTLRIRVYYTYLGVCRVQLRNNFESYSSSSTWDDNTPHIKADRRSHLCIATYLTSHLGIMICASITGAGYVCEVMSRTNCCRADRSGQTCCGLWVSSLRNEFVLCRDDNRNCLLLL